MGSDGAEPLEHWAMDSQSVILATWLVSARYAPLLPLSDLYYVLLSYTTQTSVLRITTNHFLLSITDPSSLVLEVYALSRAYTTLQ